MKFFKGLFLGLAIAVVTVTLGCMAGTATADDRVYLGFGFVKSDSNLGLRNEIGDFIAEEGYQEEVAILQSLGAPLRIEDRFTSPGGKIFFGVRMGKKRRWAFELGYIDFGNYEGSIATGLNFTVEGETEYEEQPVEGVLSATANGELAAFAQLRAVSTTFLYSFPVSKRVSIFPRFGIAKLRGDITTREQYSYDVTVNGEIGGVVPINENEQGSETETSRSKRFEALVPVVGAGFDVQVKDKWLIRTEYERYGHPTQEPSINLWSISGIRRF